MFRKLGKAFIGMTLALGMVACSQSQTQTIESVKVLCPTGAPALAILGAVGDENVSIEYTEGTDVLTAELAKENSEYDVIVAPTNLGAKIYSKTQTYNLEATLTWGNLYLVGPADVDITSASVAAFGERAVPGLVFKKVLPDLNPTYYASVQEAQQALLTGQAQVALLAQPVAAATIAKAKEMGNEFTILSDLQALYQKETGSDIKGYPQASLFVKAGNQEKVGYVLDEIQSFISECDEASINEKIEIAGVEALGIPNAQIAIKTWDKQNILYMSAKDAKENIEDFLNVFGMKCPEGFIIE